MQVSRFRSAPRSLRAGFGLPLLLALLVGAAIPVAAAPAPKPADAEATRLPGFEGRGLDGKTVTTRALAGKRLLLFCFNPGIAQAAEYADALAKLEPEQARYNFAIVGIALGLDPSKAVGFAKQHELGFPIVDDSDGRIAAGLTLQSPLMLIGADAERRVGLALVGMEHEEGLSAEVIEGRVRDYLRLPKSGAGASGKLEQLPMAPLFEADPISGPTVRLADFAGRSVVLMFFVPTCPHCQDALGFFKAALARMPEKTRPAFVGISFESRAHAVESLLEEKKLDFFPVLTDADRRLASLYGSFAGVPDIVLIDASGRIADRRMGWNEKHDPDVMRMRLAKLVGSEVPMLLDKGGYGGNDACSVCHAKEAAAWRFTDHSSAFDTLVLRGSQEDAKCVGCHVVGYAEKGGYSSSERQTFLENVGCEDCHGRGGGHLEPGGKGTTTEAATTTNYAAACLRCHDATHSLGFDYASFLPRVSHSAIAALGDAEREKLVEKRGQPRDLLPASAAYVGSEACRSCHKREYAIWSAGAHARSAESLRKAGDASDAKCVRCHVTGYGRAGGFRQGERARSGEDLARVGCESCHGPGGEHIRNDGRQAGGIVRLGDKCESCVILQICGSCHDDANDPDFRFRVAQKIDAQRHASSAPAAQ